MTTTHSTVIEAEAPTASDWIPPDSGDNVGAGFWSPDRPLPDALTAFTFAWVGQLFLHYMLIYYSWFQFSDKFRLLMGVVVTALLFWSLVRPSSLLRLSVVLIVTIAAALRGMPNHANHGLLTLLISVTFFAVLILTAVTTGGRLYRGDAAARSKAYKLAAGLISIELLLMYFFVVLHKLNHDYFNTAVSCGVRMYKEIAAYVPLMPTDPWTEWFTIGGSLLAEAGIPLLLLFARTRLLGLTVGLLFHLLLSFHPNKFVFDFSLMLCAIYVLFLPGDIRRSMLSRLARSPVGAFMRWMGRPRSQGIILGVFLLAGVAMAVLIKLHVLSRDVVIEELHDAMPIMNRAAWHVISIVFMYFFFSAVVRERILRRSDQPLAVEEATRENKSPVFAAMLNNPRLFRPAWHPLVIFPLIVLFNGFTPYLGLKTESAFAMFSNLHTEGPRNNHLFMPVVHLMPYQDVIEVLDSSEKGVVKMTDSEEGVTWFDFRKQVCKNKDASFFVTYRRNDGPPTTVTRRDDPENELFRRHNLIERTFLHFRKVQLHGPQKCGH